MHDNSPAGLQTDADKLHDCNRPKLPDVWGKLSPDNYGH